MHTCAGCYHTVSVFIQCLCAGLALAFFRGPKCACRQPLAVRAHGALTTVWCLIAHRALGLLLGITYLISPFRSQIPELKLITNLWRKKLSAFSILVFFFFLFHVKGFLKIQ